LVSSTTVITDTSEVSFKRAMKSLAMPGSATRHGGRRAQSLFVERRAARAAKNPRDCRRAVC
jgi:hypothetical protein